jgi:hypothetical protein
VALNLTQAQLDYVANAALDFHMRGAFKSSSIQKKPFLKKLREKQQTFAGGKEFITIPVKGVYSTTGSGFSGPQTVTFVNPTNGMRAVFPWFERHYGLTVDYTELKTNGIYVSGEADSTEVGSVSKADMVQLSNIWKDKLEDHSEGIKRDMDSMLFQDGTQNPLDVPGLSSIIVDAPTAQATVGGIDQSVSTWWQNRAVLGIDGSAANAANQNIVNTLQTEFRQLTRYGKGPDTLVAGSDFLTALELELRAKGNYTLDGWANTPTDGAIDGVKFKGLQVVYAPVMDDLGLSKKLYAIDTDAIRLQVMQNQDLVKHTPARPENQFVLFRSTTWTGALTVSQRNTSGVYSIA